MNRRKFLNSLVGGIAASAAVRTFPFRVFSFPSEVKMYPYFDKRTMVVSDTSLFALGDLIDVDGEVLIVDKVFNYHNPKEPATLWGLTPWK